jgi:hypothetical protein
MNKEARKALLEKLLAEANTPDMINSYMCMKAYIKKIIPHIGISNSNPRNLQILSILSVLQ